MENSTVLREESHQKSDSPVSASKSLGSLVRINSIAIDITSAVEDIESPIHEHFSIRGFVAGMRKKNRKTCLPFASQGNDDELADNLPPLVVPRFQWWQCSNCVPDINTKRSTDDTVLLLADRSDVGTSSCPIIVAEKKDLFLGVKENIASKDKAVNQRDNVAVRPLCIVDEQENVSSGKDGSFNAFPHRRKPKLRFLADIMVEKGNNSTSDNVRTISVDQKKAVSDSAEVSRSPQSKRKMVVEEEEEEEERGASAKKNRTLVLHADRKCRRVRNSESESEKDAPARLDSKLGARVEKIKKKRNKGLDISKKATRPHTLITEDRTAVSVSTMGELKTDEAEANLVPLLMATSINKESSILGDCSTKGKVGLDLSLNSFMDADIINSKNRASFVQFRGIPDLNEEFPQRTNYSDKRNFPLHNKTSSDAFASYSKESTREGKGHFGVYEPQKKDNSMEIGTSDDIPMEIVELLARNQHERALGNARRGYSGLYTDQRPGMISFPLAGRNGSTLGNGNVGVRQNTNPLINLAQFNNTYSQIEIGKPEERQFGFFSSSTSRQQHIKKHYPASGSILIGQRPSTGGAELFWPPTRENVPFHLSTNRMGVVGSYSDQCYKGKSTVMSDHHTKVVKGKKAAFEEGRVGSTSSAASGRSLDHYSNDTIPAMQLLSLMDQRIVSGSSFEVGPKRFLDSSFSSSNQNRHINGKENHNLKDLSSGFRYGGAYCSGESSKKDSSYVLGQRLDGLVIRPEISNLRLGPCTLNRNPADFSIPDVRNEFTLTAKDLKFRKRSNASKEKMRSSNLESRGKMRKDVSGKEFSRK
ncbi:hypothetical protein ACP275_01G022700 [Erythranthe tilingii]